MTEPLVAIAGLRYVYGASIALDGIDTRIESGMITGLVGPDGAGKTTLLRLMAGLLRPSGGSVHVLGHDMATDAAAAHAAIGYMPQRFGLYEDLTVAENLALFADLHRMAPALRTERVARLLRFTGLTDFTARLSGQLSGGMKQKLGLACALLSRPRLLLLDEPSVGVDPASRRELWAIVSAMLAEGEDDGMAVLWATAYLDEAARCGRVLLLHQGRLLADAPPATFLAPLQGRVFRLRVPAAQRRAIARAAVRNPAVLDALVAGDTLRIVLRTGAAMPDPAALGGIALEPIEPRFEDGFVDLLGGAAPIVGNSIVGSSIVGKSIMGNSIVSNSIVGNSIVMGGFDPATSARIVRGEHVAHRPGGGGRVKPGHDENAPVHDESAPRYDETAPVHDETAPGHSDRNEHPIAVRDLVRRFGSFTAVDHVTFSVARGEIFGLLGPNGAGKSTTFRMLCGLLRPTSGQARVAGQDLLVAPAAARARIGYMAQRFSLYAELSTRENLRFFARVYGLDRPAQTRAIDDALARFDLTAVAAEPARDLPLGLKQRLALAAALMHGPEILFLDEPTSGVDPLTRRDFWSRIGLLADAGVTILVTSHFMDEAEYCDRLGIVSAGKLAAIGSPAELRARVRSAANPDPTLEDAFIALAA